MGSYLFAQMPDAITMEPANPTIYDQITLTLDVSLSCPDSALFAADSVMMHSGVNIGDTAAWSNVVEFNALGIDGTQPKLVNIGGFPAAITIEPAGATAWEEITLTLDASLSCPDSALFEADSVMMHSGVTLEGAPWSNVIAFDALGADGTQPKLINNGDYTWSITYTPSAFYGLTPGQDPTEICCVFNAGDWAAGEGKDFDAEGNCADFFIPFGEAPASYLWQITFTPADFYGIEEGTSVTEINCVFNAGDWAAGEGKDFDMDDNCIDFVIPLGIGSVNDNPEISFRMYPNPVENVLHLDQLENASRVEIYNVVGKLVQTVEDFGNNVSINTSDFNSGVYFVTVHINGTVQSTKFIKN